MEYSGATGEHAENSRPGTIAGSVISATESTPIHRAEVIAVYRRHNTERSNEPSYRSIHHDRPSGQIRNHRPAPGPV